MALRGSQIGGGGRGGFALGTPDNIFGATSGNTDLNTITIAADRATAEATRAAYMAANPTWLPNYENRNVNTIIFYTDGSDEVAQYQLRVGTDWIDNGAPVIALRGIPGSGVTWPTARSVNSNEAVTLDSDALNILADTVDVTIELPALKHANYMFKRAVGSTFNVIINASNNGSTVEGVASITLTSSGETALIIDSEAEWTRI